MPITAAKQFSAPSGGTISIDVTQHPAGTNPCDVIFEVNLSQASFLTNENFDAARNIDCTSKIYDPTFTRIEYYWNFGEEGHWSTVVTEIPREYSLKASGRGKRVHHVFENAAMTAAGTDYTVTVMAFEPQSGKVSFAEVTVNVKNYLFQATRIVLVNIQGDTDFTAFDATKAQLDAAGWTGTQTNVNLTGSDFDPNLAPWTTYQAEDNVVWLFKGGVTYNFLDIRPQESTGQNCHFSSYGTGQYLMATTLASNSRLFLFSGLAAYKGFTWANGKFVGTFDPLTDVPIDSSEVTPRGGYLSRIGAAWWIMFHNLNFENHGPGDGILEPNGDLSRLTIANSSMLDCGHEYSYLVAGLDVELTVIGSNFSDHPSRLIRDGVSYPDPGDKGDDVRNSIFRMSNRSVFHMSKCKTFLHRWGPGQYTVKIGNGPVDGALVNIHFNVNEVCGDVYSLGASGDFFSELRSAVIENNIGIGNGRTGGLIGCGADGWVARYNVMWFPAWTTDIGAGLGNPRPRHLATIDFRDGVKPPTVDWTGAPIDLYGNTLFCELTSRQNGQDGTQHNVGDCYVIFFNNENHPYPPLDDVGGSGDNLFLKDSNLTHAPVQDTPHDASPIDLTTDVLTQSGAPISPKFAGYRLVSTGNALDTTFDISANTLPTLRIGSANTAFRTDAGSFRATHDVLGRARGPRASKGACEDTGDTNVAVGSS